MAEGSAPAQLRNQPPGDAGQVVRERARAQPEAVSSAVNAVDGAVSRSGPGGARGVVGRRAVATVWGVRATRTRFARPPSRRGGHRRTCAQRGESGSQWLQFDPLLNPAFRLVDVSRPPI